MTETNRFELRLTAGQIGRDIFLDAITVGRIVSFIKARKGIDLRQAPYSVSKPGPTGFPSQYYNGEAVHLIRKNAAEWLADVVGNTEEI